MLVSVDTLKTALGLPLTADPVADPLLENSSRTAQGLVEAYIGMPLEPGDDPMEYGGDDRLDLKYIRLPMWPCQLLDLTIEGTVVTSDQYRFDKRLGAVTLYVARPRVKYFVARYFPGYDGDILVCPQDILDAIQNIALGVYARGGTLQPAAASGALKSLTMFDAMSMSFDVGTTTADSSTPEGMVAQWAFALDKYSVTKYVMG